VSCSLSLAKKLALYSSDSSAFAKDLSVRKKVLLVCRLTIPKPFLLVYNKQELYVDSFMCSLFWWWQWYVLNQWFLAFSTLYRGLITFRIKPFSNLSFCGGRCHGCDVISYVRPERFRIALHFTSVNQGLGVSVRPLAYAHTCIYYKVASIAFFFFSFSL
jgi:hypothetical protein